MQLTTTAATTSLASHPRPYVEARERSGETCFIETRGLCHDERGSRMEAGFRKHRLLITDEYVTWKGRAPDNALLRVGPRLHDGCRVESADRLDEDSFVERGAGFEDGLDQENGLEVRGRSGIGISGHMPDNVEGLGR